MQDSDNFIPPPKLTSAPASIVPFAQAPSSMSATLEKHSAHSAHSAHSTPTPRGSDLGRASSKDASFRSKDASFRSQGSGYSSEPAREGDAHPETLPHMFNKDWELNLDALEVGVILLSDHLQSPIHCSHHSMQILLSRHHWSSAVQHVL